MRTDTITATAAHDRVYRLWGKASDHPCVFSCGRAAADWLYDGTDPKELIGPSRKTSNVKYSPFPEFYMPICRSCRHVRQFGVRVCEVDGCSKSHCARGLCGTHYKQWQTGKNPHKNPSSWHPPAPVGCSAAHSRCASPWGRASQYPCVECGKRAAQWAYDGTDPMESLEGIAHGSRGAVSYVLYSQWPEFYMPMCIPCHRRRDGAKMSEELREYRAWRLRTRMTLADCICVAEELE